MSPTAAAVIAATASHGSGCSLTNQEAVLVVAILFFICSVCAYLWIRNDRNFWKELYSKEHALTRRMYEDMHRQGGFFMSSATAHAGIMPAEGTWPSKPGMPGIPVGTAPAILLSEEDLA